MPRASWRGFLRLSLAILAGELLTVPGSPGL